MLNPLTLALFLLSAVAAYLCGCINGAIMISKVFFKDDVRAHGSGNAGLTNFYRNYGGRYAALVIALDVVKMVLAVAIAGILLGWSIEAKLWGGLFCALGHMFPVTYKFRGGKGILSCGTLLILLDWRAAVVAWGIFLLLSALTRYVSLGSVVCSASAPISVAIFYPGHSFALLLVTVIAVLVIWAHRGNIKRLVKGTESKFHFKKS